MPTHDELDKLSTKELQDRAFKLARHKLDVRFFWDLLEAAPAAEAASGHQKEADVDIMSFSRLVQDVVNPDSAEETEAFRPIYIDYLLKNES